MMRMVDHLSVEAVERRYRAAEDATEARPMQAIWRLAQGRAVLDVAGVLAPAPRWAEQLAARRNAHGPDVLGDQRRRNGRTASVLTEAVLVALAERLRAPPEDGGRWTGAKVALWMARHLGVERVYWSIQALRLRHPRSATPEQRAEFKGGSARQLRKQRQRTPACRSKSAKSRAICAGPRTSAASA